MAAAGWTQFTKYGKKIVGVGFNYVGLIKELAIPPVTDPRIYLKATSSYITQGQQIQIPTWSKEGLWYEVELGVVLEEPLQQASPEECLHAIGGYCTALDMTDRQRLIHARKCGLSWVIAKSFNTACPVGNLIPKDKISKLNDVSLWLRINGELRQSGNTKEMVWPVPTLLSIMSQYMLLEPGDMILTGTPAGIGICDKGDVITAGIRSKSTDIDEIEFKVATDS